MSIFIATVSYLQKKYQEKFGEEPVIQLNDAYAKVSDVSEWINARREPREAENKSKMVTALRVDGNTGMGIVTDVKQELRRAKALKIIYLADKEIEK